MKVITPIGAVVEVNESHYENNKHILTPFITEDLTDLVEKKVITSKDTKKKNA